MEGVWEGTVAELSARSAFFFLVDSSRGGFSMITGQRRRQREEQGRAAGLNEPVVAQVYLEREERNRLIRIADEERRSLSNLLAVWWWTTLPEMVRLRKDGPKRMPEPTVQNVAEAQRYQRSLEAKKTALEKRKVHLEKSVADLPEEVQETEAQWFSDEIRATDVGLAAVTAKLEEIAAVAAVDEFKENEENESALVLMYERAREERTIYKMNPALRARALVAVQRRAERQLAATHD